MFACEKNIFQAPSPSPSAPSSLSSLSASPSHLFFPLSLSLLSFPLSSPLSLVFSPPFSLLTGSGYVARMASNWILLPPTVKCCDYKVAPPCRACVFKNNGIFTTKLTHISWVL
jgi:hypothetical protein